MTTPERLFHICTPEQWARAQRDGELHPPSLDTEGFAHCSYADQLDGTLAKHFAGVQELVVLGLDRAGIDADVRVEDSYGSGTAFPHVYGPIPVSAVVSVRATGPVPGRAGIRPAR